MLSFLLQYAPDGYTFDDLRLKAIEQGDKDVTPALLIPALEKVSDEDWEIFVGMYLPDSTDKYSHKDGAARMNDVRDALIEICSSKFGSRYVFPVTQMKEHFKWTAVFDERVCNHIFKTGLMPSPEAAQDDLGTKPGGFAWKSDSFTIPKVVEHIISRYPNSAGSSDFKKYLNTVAQPVTDCYNTFNSLLLSTSQRAHDQIRNAIKEQFNLNKSVDIKKLQDFFTVHTNTDEYGDVIIFDVEKMTPVGQQLLTTLIEDCKFYVYIVNYVKYLAKVAYSIAASEGGGFGFLGALKDSKTDNIRNLILNTCGIKNDQATMSIYDKMYNTISQLNSANKSNTIDEITDFINVVDIFNMILKIISNVIANDTRNKFVKKKGAAKTK